MNSELEQLNNPNPELLGRAGAHMVEVSKAMAGSLESSDKLIRQDAKDIRTVAKETKDSLLDLTRDVVLTQKELEVATKELLLLVRSFRTSVLLDIVPALKALEDLRRFFLAKEHTEEVTRLKEFLDLCERLGRVKASGMLDAVADTILKLEGV